MRLFWKHFNRLRETFGEDFDVQPYLFPKGEDITFLNEKYEPVYVIRFGYYQRVDTEKILACLPNGLTVKENEMEDDDCGFQYDYVIRRDDKF